MRYVVAENRNKTVMLFEIDRASYIPAGWHKPYKYATLDNLNRLKTHPAEKRGALVHLPGQVIHANNVRMVDEATCKAIDDIDAQILALRKKRQAIIYEGFRTFPLVQLGDLKSGCEKVFTTKQEAES